VATTLKTQAPDSTFTAEGESSSAYAWYVVFVLMSCYTLSFVNRQILSLLVAPVKHDLGINDAQVGLLQGLAFASFYTLVGLPLGRVADTRGRRNLIAAGIFLWSVMTAASALANSFSSLFIVRMGVGVGEAALGPAAFSLISDYFAKKRLSLALSVYSMGIFIGSGVAFVVGGSVVDAVMRLHTVTLPIIGTIASWRVSFLAVGFPGFLFVLWLFTVKEPPRRNALKSADGSLSKVPLREVFAQAAKRRRSVLGISFGMIFQAMCSFALFNWGPVFFQRVHHFSPGQAGRALGFMIIIFGCAGMYVGGTVSDRWQHRGMAEAPLRVTAISAFGTAIPFIAAMFVSSATVALVLLAPAIFFLAMPVGSAYASVQYIFPNQLRGQVSAFVMFVLNLGGISLGAYMPGFFNVHLFHSEQMIGPSVALTVGVASLMQYILFRITYAPYRRDYELMHPVAAAAD
jgi:MFS family permease